MAISVRPVSYIDPVLSPEILGLRDHDSLLRQVLEASSDCLKLIDAQGHVCFINRSGLRLLGLKGIALLEGQSWLDFWPESEKSKIADAITSGMFGKTSKFQAFCPTAQGTVRSWDVTVTPMTSEDGDTLLLANCRDISDRMQAAETRDLLMQEIHHRVKNSLQLVQGLLSIQASNAETERTSSQLLESAARVRTIAAMHDRLYRSAASMDVEVMPYLESLIADMRTGLGSTLVNREIKLAADEARWNAADIPTLGLVMTELVTNALKYGQGTVSVGFRQNPGEQAVLTVTDEGDSLPADFDPAQSKGLGMRLVQGLVRERGGQLTVESRDGRTSFSVRLPRASLIS